MPGAIQASLFATAADRKEYYHSQILAGAYSLADVRDILVGIGGYSCRWGRGYCVPEAGKNYHFSGFVTPRYTPTPDQLFDELLAPGLLTEAELRVLLYIIRRTFGWKKESDAISLGQITEGVVRRDGERLDWGAGVAKSSAVRAVKGLVEKGIITAQRNRSPERGFEATTYALCLQNAAVAAENRPVTPLSADETRLVTPLSRHETRLVQTLADSETRASIVVKQALVAQRDIQESALQESALQEFDSNRFAPEAHEQTRFSPWIAGVIADYSEELGDVHSRAANITRALHLWQRSGLNEGAFVEHLRMSRDLTRRAQGAQGNGVIGRKMAYFFEVVRRAVLGVEAHSSAYSDDD